MSLLRKQGAVRGVDTMNRARTLAAAVALSAMTMATAAPAQADVRAGVEAWARGNYDAAIREWREPAAAGDPDAQFNLAQAYRLGRGVAVDPRQAEILYAKAAAQGHVKAADNYGLLLFQDGRREEAMPYLQAASQRGDPRAQYLLGIAHFNGDIVARDWVRAYALLTLANGAGLPQAPAALQQMDAHIPLSQRQAAQNMAQQIKRESDARRAQQFAAADLTMGAAVEDEAAMPRIAADRAAAPPAPSPAVPAPTVPAPGVVAARAAIADAARVTGSESPAGAGADYARSQQARAAPAVPERPASPAPTPSRAPSAAPTAAPTATTGSEGIWRVQLGAFGVAGNAERLWKQLASNPALAGKQRLLVPEGRLTKLQAGGFATRAAAESACAALKRAGQNCIVTR